MSMKGSLLTYLLAVKIAVFTLSHTSAIISGSELKKVSTMTPAYFVAFGEVYVLGATHTLSCLLCWNGSLQRTQ